MKKFINFCTGFVALTAFIGMTDAGIAAKAWIGDFYVPHGEKGDPGLSAYQLWLDSGHTGTVTDFLDSLKGTSIRIKGSVTNCSDLSNLTGLSVGDMYMVTNEGNKVCIYNGTSFPACPDDCDDITGPQGEQGMPGCPSLVTMAVDTDDANCYNITIVNRDYQNGGTTCQNIGTDTKQICNGTPGAPGGTCTHTSVNCGRLGEGTCPEWVNCPNRGATYTTYSGSGCGSLQPTYTCDGEPGGTCTPSDTVHCGVGDEDTCPGWVNCPNRGASYVTYSGDACGDLQHSYTCDGEDACHDTTEAGECGPAPDFEVQCEKTGVTGKYLKVTSCTTGNVSMQFWYDGCTPTVTSGFCSDAGVTCPLNCEDTDSYAAHSGCGETWYTYSCRGPQGPAGQKQCQKKKVESVSGKDGCTEEYIQTWYQDAGTTCSTTAPENTTWELVPGSLNCTPCADETQKLPKDIKGCVQPQKKVGTRNVTTHACEYNGEWQNDGDPQCDACGKDKVLQNNGNKVDGCYVYHIFEQKRAANNECVHVNEEVYEVVTEGCDPEPGQGVCDLSDAEKQLNSTQQADILKARIKTRTQGAYTAPSAWVANPGYYTDFGYYTETTAMCQGDPKTTIISDKDTDRCKVLASGGTRANQNLCADGTLYGCAVPTGEAVTNAPDGRYLVCIIDSTHKPIQHCQYQIGKVTGKDEFKLQSKCGTDNSFADLPDGPVLNLDPCAKVAAADKAKTVKSVERTYSAASGGDGTAAFPRTSVGTSTVKTTYCDDTTTETVVHPDHCEEDTLSGTNMTYKCKPADGGNEYYMEKDNDPVAVALDGKLTAASLNDYAKTAEVQTLATAAGQSAGETAANGVFNSVNDKVNKMMYGTRQEGGETVTCKEDDSGCTFTSGGQSQLMQALVQFVRGTCQGSWSTKDGCSSVSPVLQGIIGSYNDSL